MKNRKFSFGVARFFHPEKSLVIQFDERRKHINMEQKGTHQYEKSKECSNIPVYSGMGTARVFIDKFGNKSYK